MPALANPTYEVFAQHYALNGHSRKAAIEAGIPTRGWQLANDPVVQSRVSEIVARRFAKASITADRVVVELARIAFADIRDLYDDEGNLLPPPDLSDDIASIVSRIKVEIAGRGKGDDRTTVAVLDIKLADKMSALTILAKHFKIIGDESDGVNAIANILAARLDSARARDNAQSSEARIIDPTALDGVRLTYAVEGEDAATEDLAVRVPLTPNGHPDAPSDTLDSAGDDDEERLW